MIAPTENRRYMFTVRKLKLDPGPFPQLTDVAIAQIRVAIKQDGIIVLLAVEAVINRQRMEFRGGRFELVFELARTVADDFQRPLVFELLCTEWQAPLSQKFIDEPVRGRVKGNQHDLGRFPQRGR